MRSCQRQHQHHRGAFVRNASTRFAFNSAARAFMLRSPLPPWPLVGEEGAKPVPSSYTSIRSVPPSNGMRTSTFFASACFTVLLMAFLKIK